MRAYLDSEKGLALMWDNDYFFQFGNATDGISEGHYWVTRPRFGGVSWDVTHKGVIKAHGYARFGRDAKLACEQAMSKIKMEVEDVSRQMVNMSKVQRKSKRRKGEVGRQR